VNAPRRAPRRHIDGVLLFDKHLGQSSNHALQAVRRLYQAEKAGHTGTLDPLATGLLPVCFGEATKFSAELLDADKRYRATVQLGVTTDTADAEGVILQQRPVVSTRDNVETVLNGFLGDSQQIPPMYSALKRDGKPLYEYARAGVELDRPSRDITIHAIQLVEFSGDRFVFDVQCSKGTYVRTLAADIGELLGCGAHLAALRRTGIGRLEVSDAHSFDALNAMSVEQRDSLLQPPDALVQSLPEARLAALDAGKLRHGQAVRWAGIDGLRYRTYDETQVFLGVCHLQPDGWLQPYRLVATA
jgi:tRNA pseudouridine55 synthase